MAKQRKVNDLLGKNWSKNHENLYIKIEEELGISEKKCSRSCDEPHPKYGFIHEGPNPLPIRGFNFQRSSKDLLQPNCRECEKKYRKGRSRRNHYIHDDLLDDEIRERYISTYRDKKRCGHCKKDKSPHEFPISRGMESGLHNQCFDCQLNNQEAMGDRWVIYSPDGHTVHKNKRGQQCVACASKEKLHYDHRWPVSLGGSDNRENFQLLCGTCNLKKKASVDEFSHINQISKSMICARYHDLLEKAQNGSWEIRDFEIKIKDAVQRFIDTKAKMNDDELKLFFRKEKEKNNRKHNLDRCVKKFREYYIKRTL